MESNKIAGTTVVAAIVPGTTADIYPTHLAEYGKGGWRSVSNFAALSAITAGRIENGMVAYVLDQNKPYIYLDGWEELELGTKIQGVFTFKGLAEAVSPDLSYIVTCSAKSEKSILPVGTSADLAGDLYYGWMTEGDEFWTDSSILNSESVQYVRSAPVSVWGVEYKDDFYFPVNAMPAGGDDELIELQNSNGDSIFLTGNALPVIVGTWYSVYNSEEGVIGTGLGFEYTGYTFTEVIDSYPISHIHTTIQANESNSGHVYQIGENEYASNGQIWVKLGSPVEDWIII